MTTPEFDAALQTFVEGCQRIHTEYMARYHNAPVDKLVPKKGKRYVKLIRRGGKWNGSAHCFVDMTNGDVLKAASWDAPAKHARGNIFDEHNGLKSMGEHGPAYLR